MKATQKEKEVLAVLTFVLKVFEAASSFYALCDGRKFDQFLKEAVPWWFPPWPK